MKKFVNSLIGGQVIMAVLALIAFMAIFMSDLSRLNGIDVNKFAITANAAYITAQITAVVTLLAILISYRNNTPFNFVSPGGVVISASLAFSILAHAFDNSMNIVAAVIFFSIVLILGVVVAILDSKCHARRGQALLTYGTLFLLVFGTMTLIAFL